MKKQLSNYGIICLILKTTLIALILTSCNDAGQIQSPTALENPGPNLTDVRPGPVVPDSLNVPAGNQLKYHVYAKGVQIYRCTPGPNNTTTWVFVAPEANLYANAGFTGLVGTHYAGPRWESNSGSIVRGAVDRAAPSPDPNSIPWLLLHAVSSSGPGIYDGVTFIQRVNTVGGKAPAITGSSEPGTEIRIPYTAEYYFYTPGN